MMTRKDFEWIADWSGQLAYSPTRIEMIADDLETINPRFNRQKFLDRAFKAWEVNHDIDDEIPY